MGITNLKTAEGELKSILGYSVITWILIMILNNVSLPVVGTVLSLDFNLIPAVMLKDWFVISIIVLISAITVEYIEHETRIDLDKFDKFEQIITVLICLLFFPALFIFSYSGVWITISYGWQGDWSALFGSFLITVGIFNIIGIIALKIASEIY